MKREFLDRIRSALRSICFLILGLIVLPSMAAALEVKTVPWVAINPLIPHDTYSGKQITLKGTADEQGANVQYTWDFGDGSPPVTGTVSDMRAIQATHAYTGAIDDEFTARLTVRNLATSEEDSALYYIAIREQTLAVEVNIAIDEGLWYLHKTRIDTTCGTYPCSYWPNANYTAYGYVNRAAVVASAINAFEAHGHLENGDSSNPYTETVQNGLRHLFALLISENITNQPAGNPDSNGNGFGIRANGSSRYPYADGAIMDAIITSGTPGQQAVTGPVNVVGRTYLDIVQDLADSYAYGQYDSGSARGGWRYDWNVWPDNSASQWGAIGMMPAERIWGAAVLPGGIVIPAWVKTENLVWLNYSQYTDGGFGYTEAATRDVARTASGLVQLAFDGIDPSDSRWQNGERFIRDRWGSVYASGADYYAMFAFAKAMRQANPPSPQGRVMFGESSTLGALDWYGDPVNGFARRLVDRQASNGSWSGGNRSYINTPLSTPWSIIILKYTNFFTPGAPVAVAKALPNPGVVGQTITTDGSDSFHTDEAKAIDSWEWDLDNDGEFDDASGPVATASFPALGNYIVGLRVTDDGDPETEDTTTVVVRITTPPVEPTAEAGGPYGFCPQAQPWFLDGSGSVNPDDGVSLTGQADYIREYAWDLDSDGQYDDALGPQPDVTAYFSAMGPGSYLVRLRVTDNTAAAFGGDFEDLTDADSAQVFVKAASDPDCTCISDLAARSKLTKVQLTWTDTGALFYNIYRGTAQGGPYTYIATTASTYSTYLDQDVVTGNTYYYIVREVALNLDEVCQSNEAAATLTARRR